MLPAPLYPALQQLCQDLAASFDQITSARRKQLDQLKSYIQQVYDQGEVPRLIVICTHNSRRSHLAQLWLAVGVDYYGLPKAATYSGGTEATALNPRVVAALERVGFKVTTDAIGADNPHYHIRWRPDGLPYTAFSKDFGDPPNPRQGFAAVMVCTDADEDCPLVPGSAIRISLPYEDPKAYDGTPEEATRYDQKLREIGREMLYVLQAIAA